MAVGFRFIENVLKQGTNLVVYNSTIHQAIPISIYKTDKNAFNNRYNYNISD